MTDVNIIDCAVAAGYEPRSYSGRGMFGKQCVAFEGDDYSASTFVCDVAQAISEIVPKEDQHDLFDMLKSVRSDSMGKGYVYYFPTQEYSLEDED